MSCINTGPPPPPPKTKGSHPPRTKYRPVRSRPHLARATTLFLINRPTSFRLRLELPYSRKERAQVVPWAQANYAERATARQRYQSKGWAETRRSDIASQQTGTSGENLGRPIREADKAPSANPLPRPRRRPRPKTSTRLSSSLHPPPWTHRDTRRQCLRRWATRALPTHRPCTIRRWPSSRTICPCRCPRTPSRCRSSRSPTKSAMATPHSRPTRRPCPSTRAPRTRRATETPVPRPRHR